MLHWTIPLDMRLVQEDGPDYFLQFIFTFIFVKAGLGGWFRSVAKIIVLSWQTLYHWRWEAPLWRWDTWSDEATWLWSWKALDWEEHTSAGWADPDLFLEILKQQLDLISLQNVDLSRDYVHCTHCVHIVHCTGQRTWGSGVTWSGVVLSRRRMSSVRWVQIWSHFFPSALSTHTFLQMKSTDEFWRYREAVTGYTRWLTRLLSQFWKNR